MADLKINDLASAPVASNMQLETDINGTNSNKIDIGALTTYLASVLPISGITWNVVNSNTTLAANNGYIPNGLTTIIFTLPETVLVGSVFKIAGYSNSGWSINQNASQTLYLGNQSTTTGVSGSISSTLGSDSVEIICVKANEDFVVVSCVGNLDLT